MIEIKSEQQNNLETRPPVVVILGHIDHGKTSLLNALRQLQFSAGKPGGFITQHIGAFEIEREGKKITFIDTPGHEAFSAMRSRGTKVADIAVLVIAADEGVKAQTKEAIFHIKKAQIPMIVAINKIDKPEANPEKIKQELQKENILVESFGGRIPSVNVSAKTGQGLEEFLEIILLVAEMENLKTDISVPSQGIVIESYLDSQQGPIATLIPFQGILQRGQIIGTNSTFGKIKALKNSEDNFLKEVFPSQPAVVLGFEDVPGIGEEFKIFSNFEEAKNNLKSKEKKRIEIISSEPEQKIINLILKADVLGSLEALEETLKELPQEKVFLRVLKAEVGEVTESDFRLARQARAKILAFRVKINPIVQQLAEREKIGIIQFEVIYDLVEAVRKYMEKFLEPEIIRIDLGKIKVLLVFLTEKNRQIIGGKVIEGEAKKGVSIEILRQGEIIGQGKLVNLQQNKKDIESAKKGEEVGILYEGKERIEENDILILYTEKKRKSEL